MLVCVCVLEWLNTRNIHPGGKGRGGRGEWRGREGEGRGRGREGEGRGRGREGEGRGGEKEGRGEGGEERRGGGEMEERIYTERWDAIHTSPMQTVARSLHRCLLYPLTAYMSSHLRNAKWRTHYCFGYMRLLS